GGEGTMGGRSGGATAHRLLRGSREGDEILERGSTERGVNKHRGRRAAQIRNMGKIAHPVVAEMAIESRRDHIGGDAGDDQSISVGVWCPTGGCGRGATPP